MERVVLLKAVNHGLLEMWIGKQGYTSVVEMVRIKEGRDNLQVEERLPF
jgi:hypothetical protein